MKRKFSAILLVLMMMLTFSAITAAAETTPLEVTYYNIISNSVRLEFSGEVTNVTAVVKGTGTESEKTIAVTATADSADSKVWNLKLSEKMDITKKYMLSFTATPTDSTTYSELTATKLITFNVIWNDDFDTYSTLADMTEKYDVKYVQGGNTTYPVTDENAKVELDSENNRIKLTTNDHFLRIKGSVPANAYYTAEFVLENAVSESTASPAFALHTRVNYEWGTHCVVSMYSNGFHEIFNKKGAMIPNYVQSTTKTFALTRKNIDTTNAFYALYADDQSSVCTAAADNNIFMYNTHFGISAFGSAVYLDSLKLYTASMADYTPMAFDLINVTTKGITVSYNNDIEGTPEVHLYKGDNTDIKGTVTVNGGKINIVPSEQLDLSKKYLLKIGSVSDGIYTVGEISKLISFNVIVNDDFESYNNISDLDAKYVQLNGYNWDVTSISGSNKFELVTDSNGNKRILASMDGFKGLWRSDLNYSHTYKYYNFEVDFETTLTNDGTGADKYIFGIRHANINVAYGANVYFHSGNNPFAESDQRVIVNNNAFFKDSVKFSNTKYNYAHNNTYAFSLSTNGTNDFYNIYENGTNLVTMKGTYPKDNFFYIIEAHYTKPFYIDNYKLYAPVLTDADAFPAFSAEKTLTTSKYIKVTFNEAIDEADLASKVSVTSLGSPLQVTTSLENDGKTLVIAPESGMFAFDREITYKIEGLSNVYGTTASYIEKKIMLQKLWYETFDNATDLSDLYGSYGVASDNDVVQPLENYKEAFSIVSDGNGGKRLAMTNTNNRSFTHFEKYPQRNNWVDYITEFDYETSGNKTDGFDYNYRMQYNKAVNGIGWGWYNEGRLLRIQAGSINNIGPVSNKFTLMTTTEKNASDNKYTVTIYKDDVPYTATKTYTGGCGEFGFRNFSTTDTMYIDNIKCYKVVDFSADEALFITGATANGNTASGTVTVVSYKDAIPAGKLIVAAYGSDNKLIGINFVTSNAVSANEYGEVPYTVNCSKNDIYRISVFLWDGLDTMTPIMANKTTTDINVVTSQPAAAQ